MSLDRLRGRGRRPRALRALGAALGFCACTKASPVLQVDAAPAQATRSPEKLEVAEVIYDGGLQNGWMDWGWSQHELSPKAPARIRFNDFGGWIIARPGLTGDFGDLVFRVKAPPAEPEFLEVRVQGASADGFTGVPVRPEHRLDVGDGWVEVKLPMAQLNPDGKTFDRVVFRAARATGKDWVLIDRVVLTKAPPPKAAAAYDRGKLQAARMAIDCRGKAQKISPMIYGIASYPFHDAERQKAQWNLGATIRRWGGNTASTYNYLVGAWNSGSDWYYENNPVSHELFFKQNAEHGVMGALTVPIMGWVSKDKTSSSFPVSVFGPQQSVDPYRPSAGNGKDKSGKEIKAGAQSNAYTPIDPAFVKRWVQAIREGDQKSGHRSVHMYILDNEPTLWHVGHRDAHPEPLSYDELVARTIDFGTAVREADPQAVIAGPAEWGWMGYFYSGKDYALGINLKLDRRAHGDEPLLAWYLKKLAEHEKKTGVRVLDVLDVHNYPQQEKVGSDASDPDVAALRIRATRQLWDPTYVDESWIKEPIKLLPRLQKWIDDNYPGRGIAIGEWNYGAEGHISGGLAIAEALGRFAQGNVTAAYYWVYPPEGSPAMHAFRAYRNFDGKGGHFQDWLLPSTAPKDTSLFASRDHDGKTVVAIALNLSRKDAVNAKVDVSSCGAIAGRRAFTYQGGSLGLTAAPEPALSQGTVEVTLPPYSISVIELTTGKGAP